MFPLSSTPSSDPVWAAAGGFPAALALRLTETKIIAVITVDDVRHAVPLARALVAGGIQAIELAWRTPATMEALVAIIREAPGILAGVGTLLTPEQVHAAAAAGAEFGVSPGMNAKVVQAARAIGLPFSPGVQTASDIQVAIDAGCSLLKYFPAETAGGLPHLHNLNSPFAHLGLRYLALGGINEVKASSYLAEPLVAAIGGSWIAPHELIRKEAWGAIRQNAAAARRLAKSIETSRA